MREPERLDLSALDPRRDPERWEQMVRQIMWRSSAELQRRQGSAVFGLFDGLVAWSRPALAAAAALAALSLVTLSQFRPPTVVTQATYFQSPGLPAQVAVMLEEGQALSMLDLLVMSGEN
jgi:hypothetical protein